MIIEEEVYLGETTELGEEFMEHFGTKGMQWGVRKAQLKRGQAHVQRGAKITAKAVNKTVHDETFLRVVRTGAIITAAILLGGVGGMAVGALTTQVGSPDRLVPLVKHERR